MVQGMTALDDSIVYLNGEFVPLNEAKISVMDRGFLFGDGVYEVIPVYGGQDYGVQLRGLKRGKAARHFSASRRQRCCEFVAIFTMARLPAARMLVSGPAVRKSG